MGKLGSGSVRRFEHSSHGSAVKLDLHVVSDFNNERFVLHVGDDSVDSGIRDDLIAGFDGFHEFGMFLRLLLLRTDEEKVKDKATEDVINKRRARLIKDLPN